MPPRKSPNKRPRVDESQPIASSSTITIEDIPPPVIPESITNEYVASPSEKAVLSSEAQEQFVMQLFKFSPRKLLRDIISAAREHPYAVLEGFENWAREIIRVNDLGIEYERELEVGAHALETLLEQYVDRAMEKFEAYTLRNSFSVPDDLELVLPWQRDLDFARGQHVASLPKGEETLSERLEKLRTTVEQYRLLQTRLAEAEQVIDRRLEVARQRKTEVGFVNELLESHDLHPLSEKSGAMSQSLLSLHAKLQPLEPAGPTPIPAAAPGAKAWELGRQAYLNWAIGKMLNPAEGGAGDGIIEGAEKEVEGIGAAASVEALQRHLE
ncbi:hypothetical protein Q5752_006810 [Cryptotrichosporon argae]